MAHLYNIQQAVCTKFRLVHGVINFYIQNYTLYTLSKMKLMTNSSPLNCSDFFVDVLFLFRFDPFLLCFSITYYMIVQIIPISKNALDKFKLP